MTIRFTKLPGEALSDDHQMAIHQARMNFNLQLVQLLEKNSLKDSDVTQRMLDNTDDHRRVSIVRRDNGECVGVIQTERIVTRLVKPDRQM